MEVNRYDCSHLNCTDVLSGSLACLYDYMSPEQTKDMKIDDETSKFYTYFCSSSPLESMVSQRIGFTTPIHNLNFSDIIMQKCLHVVKNLSIQQWKIYVDGFPGSGKTTVLSLLAYSCVNELIRSKKLRGVFIFPVNWEFVLMKISDVSSLYNEVVALVIKQLGCQAPRIFPISVFLTNWFQNLSYTAVSPPLPSAIRNCPFFPVSQIEALGNRICNAFQQGPYDIKSLLRLIAELPSLVPQLFGFPYTLHIYDNIDFCEMTFSSSNDESEDSAEFAVPFIKSISSEHQLFIISVKNGISISFDDIDSAMTYVDTTDMIQKEDIKNLPTLLIHEPTLRVTPFMCRGCPRILHAYITIVEKVKLINNTIDQSLAKFGYSATTKYEMESLRQLTKSFLSLLEKMSIEGVTSDLIKSIDDTRDFFVSLDKN